MSGNYYDLPDLPGEWRVSINKENHVCAHKDVRGSKIIVTPDQSPLSSGWTVGVIGSDLWEKTPHFVEDADMDEVGETMVSVAEALDTEVDGEIEVEPVGYVDPVSTHDSDESEPEYAVVNRAGSVVETGFESESEAEAAVTEYDEVSPGHSPHDTRRMEGEKSNDVTAARNDPEHHDLSAY